MNDQETMNTELEPTDGPKTPQETDGNEGTAQCECPHRGFRAALYTLVAFALLGNVAVRAAPGMTGSVTDFVQTQMLGFMGAPQACSGATGNCCPTTFVYEGNIGLPCCGEMECTGESADTDFADPTPPTNLSERIDLSGESEPDEPSELTMLADEAGELAIDVQR